MVFAATALVIFTMVAVIMVMVSAFPIMVMATFIPFEMEDKFSFMDIEDDIFQGFPDILSHDKGNAIDIKGKVRSDIFLLYQLDIEIDASVVHLFQRNGNKVQIVFLKNLGKKFSCGIRDFHQLSLSLISVFLKERTASSERSVSNSMLRLSL